MPDFFVSAPDISGFESPKRILSQKLGIGPGVGAIVNIQECSSVSLALLGVVNKLPSLFIEKVNMVTATTDQQSEYLFNANLRYPLIYIQDFGHGRNKSLKTCIILAVFFSRLHT